MTSPAQFLEEIKVANVPIGKDGYKMDAMGAEGMPRRAGLKGCHCCDYFIQNGESIVLIEETRLAATIARHKTEYHYLHKDHLDDLTTARIREENTLKVYGALLVLCRLAAQFGEFEKVTRAGKYNFWLVVSDIPSVETVALAELQSNMFNALRSVFGKSMIGEIKVIPGDMLADKIASYAPIT